MPQKLNLFIKNINTEYLPIQHTINCKHFTIKHEASIPITKLHCMGVHLLILVPRHGQLMFKLMKTEITIK